MDLTVLLPGLALAAGIAWPAIRRHAVVTAGRRTLANSRRQVLPL